MLCSFCSQFGICSPEVREHRAHLTGGNEETLPARNLQDTRLILIGLHAEVSLDPASFCRVVSDSVGMMVR